MGAAFRLYNTVGSAGSLPQNFPQVGLKPSANFDPIPFIPEDKKIYASWYAFANNRLEVDAVSRRIDDEESDRRTMSNAGVFGVLGAIGAGIVDPINYAIPVLGNAGKGRGLISVLRNGATHAAVGLGTVSLQSALLHQTQVTRTLGESANDIAVGTFLSGLLGASGSAVSEVLGSMRGAKVKSLGELHAPLERELTVPKTGRYVPAEVAQVEAASKQALETLDALKLKGVTSESPEYIQATLKAKETGTRLESMLDDIHELDPMEPGYFEIPEAALLEDTAPGGNGSATGKALERQVFESPVFEPVLPAELSKSKPRYNFGDKAYNSLEFASDVDKALYIVAQKSPSKRDADFLQFLKTVYPDKTDGQLRAMGQQLRNEVIKPLAQAGEGGSLQVPKSHFDLGDSLPVKTPVASQSADGTMYASGPDSVDVVVSETPARKFVDFVGVGEEAPAAVKTEPSKRALRKQQLDELQTTLDEVRQTATPEAGEGLATDFLDKFDIPYEKAKKVGSGTGFRVKVPYKGYINFPRGASLAQLMELGVDPRKLAGMMKGQHEDIMAALQEAKGSVIAAATDGEGVGYSSGIAGDTSVFAAMEADANKILADMDAQFVQGLRETNKLANQGLDMMASAQTVDDFNAASELLLKSDFDIMPDSFWSEVSEVTIAARSRISQRTGAKGRTEAGPGTGQASAGGNTGNAGQAEPSPASARDPGNTDLGNGDTLGDPIAYETADGWEEVYSAKQMGFPDEALNAANLDERLKDHGFIAKLPLTNRQDPLIRTQLSPSIETRRTVQRLVETPLKYEKNALGVATEVPAEALARQYKAPLAFSLKHLDDLFVEYRTGAAKAGGKAMALVQDAVGGVEGKLSFDEFKQTVGKAMRQGDVHPIPQVAQAAQNFRRMVFDPLKDQAIRLGVLPAGVETETAATYLTRVWDVERIAAQRDEFYQLNLDWLKQKESLLEPAARRSNADLEDIADQIIDRILGTPEGRLPYDLLGEDLGTAERNLGGGGGQGLSKPLKERVYDIPDEWVEDFLHNDIEHVAKIYERSMASDLALLERFGSVDLQPELQAIRRDYAAKAKEATDNKARLQLKRKMDSDIRDVAAMRDRIRGIYGMPADPSSTFVRAGKALRSLNFLSLMGGVTLSSLADLARPMMVHGLQRYLTDGLVPLVSNFKAFRASAQEVKLAGTALDMILESRAAGIGELMDDYGRGSKLERLLHGTASMYGKGTGLSQWTATMKQWSGMMTQSRMIQAALDVQAGTVAKKELQNLAASYIDPDMAKRIAQQFEKYGERNGTVLLPNTVNWTDREAVKLFRAGLAKEVDKIVVTPGAGDKPLWLSNEWGKLFGQFKSFFISATQRVLLSGLQDRDLGVLNGAVFATSLGVVTTLLQSKLSGREISMKPADLILEGVDRAGLMGWLFEMNGSVEKLTRGHYGLSRLTGKEPMSRFASRNITDSLLGPSVGRVEDFAKITGALAGNEWKASDARALRRLLPFQNLFYLRQVFDKGQEGFMNVMGIEDTREAKSE